MFIGAYLQGVWRSRSVSPDATTAKAD
jgi:hypothetical protein